MENEVANTNPTWIDEGWQKALDILNQPFIIAILVAVIIGIFLVILFRSSSLGKKSIERQDDKIKAQEKSQTDFINYEKNKDVDDEKKNEKFKTELKNKVTNFINDEEGFKKLVIDSLSQINNVHIKKLLEESKYGESKETKDN